MIVVGLSGSGGYRRVVILLSKLLVKLSFTFLPGADNNVMSANPLLYLAFVSLIAVLFVGYDRSKLGSALLETCSKTSVLSDT